VCNTYKSGLLRLAPASGLLACREPRSLLPMQRHPPTVLWSPHSAEVFAIGMSDQLRLYEFSHGSSADGRDSAAAPTGGAPVAESTAGSSERPQSMHLISSLGDVHQLRCASWSPRSDDRWKLAVGTASGRVVLHDCTPASSQGRAAPTSAQREFVPHSQRSCFSLAWNHVYTNQIAAGLDKVRARARVLSVAAFLVASLLCRACISTTDSAFFSAHS